LEQGKLPKKFEINRQKFTNKLNGLTWARPSDVYHSLKEFSLFNTIDENDIK